MNPISEKLKSIVDADKYLNTCPGSYAALIVSALRDDLVKSTMMLVRILTLISNWSDEYDQFHTTAQANEAHKVAVSDLITRTTAILKEEEGS
jgi:hypothetical protein